MAFVLKGKNKGNEIKIHQYCNDWIMGSDGKVYNPTSLQYTFNEFDEILNNKNLGIMLNLYKPDFDKLTFKKIKSGKTK